MDLTLFLQQNMTQAQVALLILFCFLFVSGLPWYFNELQKQSCPLDSRLQEAISFANDVSTCENSDTGCMFAKNLY